MTDGVRRAGRDDGPAIAAVQIASWRATYPQVAPHVLAALREERCVASWTSHVQAPVRRDLKVLVHSCGDGPIDGYAAAHSLDADPGVGYIASLYVHPEATGKGVGRDLLASALTELRGRGHLRVVLDALRDVAGARGFYEHLGWRVLGDPAPAWHDLPQVRYEAPARQSFVG